MIDTQDRILLIDGSSGTGKTTLARQIGLRRGMSWLQADDLRLALQRSRATLPEQTDALYFLAETPNLWALPPERLRDGLIALGQTMSPALEVVIEHHVDLSAPIILEGDCILPALMARPSVRDRAHAVRAVFLIKPDEAQIYDNIVARNRGIEHQSEAELLTEARAKWLYGQWLAAEAQRYGLPTLEPRPYSTLAERVEAIFNR